MTSSSSYQFTEEDFNADGYGGERPHPGPGRAHLADIVSALWAHGYRPFTAPGKRVDQDSAVGHKAVHVWRSPASGKEWTLYVTSYSTSNERIITAVLADSLNRELFRTGDDGQAHYKVLAEINAR